MAMRPRSLTLRCYGVGFGDCFLMTFHYAKPADDRHILIDFGSTQKPPNARKKLMNDIADDIASVVGKKLHMLVATHRHADHINGFATNARGTAPGDVIRTLKPQMVIQPWTERPDAPKNFQGAAAFSGPAADQALRQSLANMSAVAAAAMSEARHMPAAVADQVRFVGADGVKNMSAIKNLAAMGKASKALYVQYGSKIPNLATLLPGVKVTVLGPPTIAQKADVLKQNPVNRDEYWHFSRFWAMRSKTAQFTAGPLALFPDAATYPNRSTPFENRWFVRRLKALRADQMLGLVRAMDDALNNTSVILLFEVGGRKLLFPGDAQWENWELALTKKAGLLEDVDVYKVGHHGSLNATPKTLWNGFSRRSKDAADPDRLCTVMSTRSHSKHGSEDNESEVPRGKLVTALKQFSRHRSTQELEARGDLVLTLEFPFGKR